MQLTYATRTPSSPTQDKQQGDRHIGEMINGVTAAAPRQGAGHGERPDQRQSEVVRQELGA
jgi:hypothetical protein